MKLKQAIRATAVAVVLGLAATGCSTAAGSSGSSTPSAPQTLNLSIQAPPSNFSIGNWSGGDSTLYNSVYDSVLNVTPAGKLVPGLATSWSYSSNNLKLTFKIRTGQKFTDGETVNASAVAASLKVARKAPSTSGVLTSISGVSAPNATTLVLTLSRPDASLLTVLASNAGAVGAPEYLTAKSSQLTPVGSGAYTLDSKLTTVGSLYTLVRNPHNWNVAKYPFETVKVRVIADPTASQNALKDGQLDIGSVTASTLPQFPSSQFNKGVSLPQAVGSLYIADRAGKVVPALASVKVRRAINMAIDRNSIATKLLAGTHPTEQVVGPTGPAYSKALDKTYAFNVAAAKKLMAEAGYAHGFSLTMPSTVVSQQVDSTISQELGAIGIKVTYETVAFQDFPTKVLSGDYGMFFMFNGYSGSAAGDITSNTQGLFNPFNTTTPKLTALLTAANAAPLDKQPAAFAAVNKYLVDQAWFAPIIYSTSPYVTSKKITYTPPVSTGLNLLPFGLAKSTK